MDSAIFSSPVGMLHITCSDSSIQSLTFIEQNTIEAPVPDHSLLKLCFEQLTEYFDGNRKTFSLPLQQQGTDFQQKVWAQLQQIPYGKTISYLELARQLGDTKAIRAVGAANGRNKLTIVVPCHRVIGSNAKLTGYAGGLWRKQWLLEHEVKYYIGVQKLF